MSIPSCACRKGGISVVVASPTPMMGMVLDSTRVTSRWGKRLLKRDRGEVAGRPAAEDSHAANRLLARSIFFVHGDGSRREWHGPRRQRRPHAFFARIVSPRSSGGS